MKKEIRLVQLEREKRFHRKKTMFYRSNLLLHTERVGYLLEEYISHAEQVFGKEWNSPMARAISKVFDDFEIKMGEMDPEERVLLEISENMLEARRRDAARELLEHTNGLCIDGIPYGIVLTIARRRTSLEAQLVNWCDSFNGFGESLHELYAGNRDLFFEPVQAYITKLRAFPQTHPKLSQVFNSIPDYFAIPEFEEPSRPHLHTQSSLQKTTGYAPYDFWRKTILKHGEEKALLSLVQQKEYVPATQKAAK